MASINFLYRSIKSTAPLVARLLFRAEGKDYVYAVQTKFEVSKIYWEKQHRLKRPKDVQISNKQIEVNTELNSIENHLLTAFKIIPHSEINKEWLKQQLDQYYNPREELHIPALINRILRGSAPG